ncbi:MAG: hypothetical protein AAF441_06515 [Pseudomonadota bacterium]
MKPPFDFILFILNAAWRRRYLICSPILFMPVIGWLIGQTVTISYKARTSVLVQESAKHNPFMKDISVDTNLKKRMPGLKTLLHSEHVLEAVLVETGQITETASAYERGIAVRRLSSALTVNLVGPDLVEFTFKHTNPNGMARVLDAVRRKFVSQMLSPERSTIDGSQAFLKKQLGLRRQELDGAERAYRAFQTRHSAELPELQSVNLQRLAGLQQKLEDKRVELSSAAAALEVRRRRLARSNPLIGRLEEGIVTANGELASLRSRYTDRHSKVRKVRQRLQRLRKERQSLVQAAERLTDEDLDRPWNMALGHRGGTDGKEGSLLVSQMERVQEAAADSATLRQEVHLLEKAVDRLRTRITKTSEVNHRKQGLEHAITLARKNFEDIAERYESARVVGALGKFEAPERVKIIEPAVDPTVPVTPGTLIFVLGGLFGGLTMGGGLAFVAEMSDPRLLRRQAFEGVGGAPVVLRLPAAGDGITPSPKADRKGQWRELAARIGHRSAAQLRNIVAAAVREARRRRKRQAA